MSSFPVTIRIPTPSEEERIMLGAEVAFFTHIDKMVSVFLRPSSVLSDGIGAHQNDTILFSVSTGEDERIWYIQQPTSIIEDSLASLFGIHTWQVVAHAPVYTIEEGCGWRSKILKPSEIYKREWNTEGRLEFAFEIRREFRCDEERADKMGYPRRIRKIRKELYEKEDPKLYYSYDEYLGYYRMSLPENTKESWARLRDYFREKTVRAAAEEGISKSDLDPILNTPLALRDAEDAKKPIGGLDEDYFEYGA